MLYLLVNSDNSYLINMWRIAMATPVKIIITHPKPHLDEVVAITLLTMYGLQQYPGVEKAKFAFLDGSQVRGIDSEQELRENGRLFVGVGGGRFDEHAAAGNARKSGHCAATLIADDLGISNDPAVKKILRETVSNDLSAGEEGRQLGREVQDIMEHLFDVDPSTALRTAMTIVAAKLDRQAKYYEACEIVRTSRLIRMIQSQDLGMTSDYMSILLVQSDHPSVMKGARSQVAFDRFGYYPDIIIKRDSGGNVQIFTNSNHFEFDLGDLAYEIRYAELTKRGIAITPELHAKLDSENGTDFDPWHFPHFRTMLFNGSKAHPNVPPTRLNDLDILRCILSAFCTWRRVRKPQKGS